MVVPCREEASPSAPASGAAQAADSRHSFDENHGGGSDSLDATERTQALGRRGLHRDRRSNQSREFAGHQGHVVDQFRPFGDDRDVS